MTTPVEQESTELGATWPRIPPRWVDGFGEDEFGIFAEFEVGGVGFLMRWIPPGSFRMGSPVDEPGRFDDEGPRHEVRLTRGFWMGEAPVTQAQWRAVVRADGTGGKDGEGWSEQPSRFRGPDTLPVENVTWHDVLRWTTALQQRWTSRMPEGLRFRLPTEAEWEYACRAGTETALYSGGITLRGENDAPELDEIAWYGGNSGVDFEVENPEPSEGWPKKQHPHSKAGTHRVKLKRPNSWGLYDAIGNVWEWCWDGRRTFEARIEVDPLGPCTDRAARVARGGSWVSQARRCRAAPRIRVDPGDRWDFQGFRLVAGQELSSGAGGSGR